MGLDADGGGVDCGDTHHRKNLVLCVKSGQLAGVSEHRRY